MNEAYNMETKRVSKKALFKCFINWIFFAHGTYNYERLQGTGFLHSMCPIIDDLYDKDDMENRKAAMKRHNSFFNTEPRLGSMIVGLCAALEEKIASKGTDLDADNIIPSIKNGLMGPISGIGDTVMQAILSPLLLSMAVGIAQGGNVFGPILYVVMFIIIVAALGYNCFMLGYKKGDEAIVSFIERGIINKVISGAGILGCTVMGALVAKFVNLNTIVSFELKTGTFDLQANVFDAIMPNLLPLLLTMLVYKMMKEGTSALKMMGVLVVAGAVLGILGII